MYLVNCETVTLNLMTGQKKWKKKMSWFVLLCQKYLQSKTKNWFYSIRLLYQIRRSNDIYL